MDRNTKTIMSDRKKKLHEKIRGYLKAKGQFQ